LFDIEQEKYWVSFLDMYWDLYKNDPVANSTG